MKSFPRVKIIASTALVFSPVPLLVRAGNSCDCPSPPGGIVRCEDHQAAFCTTDKDGTIRAECKSRPKESSRGLALRAWILAEVLGRPVKPSDIESTSELQTILNTGRYENPTTGVATTFRLPKE